jgi:hypothetical protein
MLLSVLLTAQQTSMLPTIIGPLLDAPSCISLLLWHIAVAVQQRAYGGGICRVQAAEAEVLRGAHLVMTGRAANSSSTWG